MQKKKQLLNYIFCIPRLSTLYLLIGSVYEFNRLWLLFTRKKFRLLSHSQLLFCFSFFIYPISSHILKESDSYLEKFIFLHQVPQLSQTYWYYDYLLLFASTTIEVVRVKHCIDNYKIMFMYMQSIIILQPPTCRIHQLSWKQTFATAL